MAQKPTVKSRKQSVTCPHCGHKQLEPPAAYSTVCKGCGKHIRIEDTRRPAAKRTVVPVVAEAPPRPKGRAVTCFKCGTELSVAASAQSTMCKRCSSHLDLRDYQITAAVSKNFQTKGRFVIEQGGYVFNTETTATDIVIKGKFLGKLHAENTLEIHSTADLKGTFKAGKLIIPAGQRFNWQDNFTVRDAEIAGECTARVAKASTIVLKPTARFFGDITSANLIVEPGAVLVGTARIGVKEPELATKPAREPSAIAVRPAARKSAR